MLYYLRYFAYWLTWPIRAMFYSPDKILAFPRKILSVSLPMRVAIMVSIFLLVAVTTSYVTYAFFTEEALRAASWWGGAALFGMERWLVIPLLVIVIPIVVYYALRLWLEGDVSPFPDIDFAWKAGMTELKKSGLDITQIPLFLVLGSASDAQEKLLVDAAQLNLRVRDVPQGPAPLHWYANPDAIYLFCSEAGALSKLAAMGRQAADEEADVAALRAARRSDESSLRQTFMPDSDDLRNSGSTEARGTPNIRGTMVIGGDTLNPEDDHAFGGAIEKKAVVLAPEEGVLQGRRLEYVCRLLRRARQPLCPINGVLTILPYDLIERGPREAIQLQRAVKSDTWIIRRDLKLRCPTTALIVGMEQESGFRELLRRVGRDRSRAQRFGKGHGLWSPVTPEQMEAVAMHACGAFEDWVYSLFRERGSLAKPGNTKLYALLCKVRRDAAGRISGILRSGYAPDPQDDQQVEPLLFGGCYFAALGESESRQAFVRSVFDKLAEQQEDLEWTQAALLEEQRFSQVANAVFVLDVIMLFALGGLILYSRLSS